MGNYWLNKDKEEKTAFKRYREMAEKYLDKDRTTKTQLRQENEKLKEELVKIKKDMEDGFKEAYQIIKTVEKQRTELEKEHAALLRKVGIEKFIKKEEVVSSSNPKDLISVYPSKPRIGSKNLMSDYEIYTKWLKYSDEDAKDTMAKMKAQKLEEMKIQILMNNPQILGVEYKPAKDMIGEWT